MIDADLFKVGLSPNVAYRGAGSICRAEYENTLESETRNDLLSRGQPISRLV